MIRNIGALLVKGFKPRDIFTQHMAKYTSPTQGKDGTSHFGDLKTPPRCLPHLHAGRPDSGNDGRGHGRPLSGTEDRRHDLDWRRRELAPAHSMKG